MKNRELISLWNAISNLTRVRASARFNYAVCQAARAIESTIDSLKKAQELPPELKAWGDQRDALLMQHAIRDEKQQPVIRGGNVELRDKDEFDKALTKLKKEHGGDPDEARKKHRDEYEALLDTEVDPPITLPQVPLKIVPDIPHGIFDGLFPLIKDPAGVEEPDADE